MLHLKNAGFDFEIATPTGKPVVFEMWAFPEKDEHVKAIYNEHKSSFEKPKKLTDFIEIHSIIRHLMQRFLCRVDMGLCWEFLKMKTLEKY